jgi:hypothetical protein
LGEGEGEAAMNLIWLFLVLALVGFVFAKVEPLLVVPAMAPLALFKTHKTPLFYFFAALGWLWQIYVVLAWCTLALMLTSMFSGRPTVEHHWIYYVMGFFGCLAPISFMLSFDRDRDRELDPMREVQQFLTLTLTAAGFIGFAVMPSLMLPWHWVLRFAPRG